VHLLTAVQCISALLKANCSLDPTAKVFDFAQADHLAVQTTLQYVFNLPDSSTKSEIESTQLFSQEDFIILFSSMLSQLEIGGGGTDERYNLKAQSPIRRTKNIQFSYEFSEFGERTDSRSVDSEHDSNSNKSNSVIIDDEVSLSDDNSKSNHNSSGRMSLDMDAMKADSDEDADSVFSEVNPQKVSVYKNDKAYPPSAAVLELRAAQSILGLENYNVCSLMDSLAAKSEEGVIKLGPWLRWLSDVMLAAKVSNQDIKIASNLGTKLFEVFQSNCSDALFDRPSPFPSNYKPPEDNSSSSSENEVLFSTFAAGLAFLCGGSPTEDKMMVAFTLVDSDSDGFITQEEFKELVTAALKTVAVCSKLIQAKVLHLNTHVR